jgi:hypothetical protein
VDVRRREHAIISCYHEAGHAVMAWYHGIKILYVTMTPADDHAHSGLTATADDDIIGLAETEARMQVAAAGEIAANWRLPVPEELTDDSLLRRFARDERVIADSDIPRFNDRLIFAWWGRTRDEVIRNAAPDEASGPASWLPIFRDAKQLIHGDLWPAVEAVAEDLSWSTSDLSYEDVATLATAATYEPPPDTSRR